MTVAHGLCHLLGYRHDTKPEWKQVRDAVGPGRVCEVRHRVDRRPRRREPRLARC